MKRPIRSTPSEGAPAPAPAAAADSRVALRLAVARGALGLELYEPFDLGPISVRGLVVSLQNLRFPVDLSGGVSVFRHRRGQLEKLELALRFDGLVRWATPRLREPLGKLLRPVTVWGTPSGLGLGLVGERGALAFELMWAPADGDARVIVADCRAVGLDGPPLVAAIAVIDTLAGSFATRRGRIVTVARAGSAVARAVLPAAGARAPHVGAARFSELSVTADEAVCTLDSSQGPPPLRAECVRALELATLAASADEALALGRSDEARALYVAALEQAPRHPEILRLIAEIDLHAAGRAEAALAMLSETLDVSDFGVAGAQLLARAGDSDGAAVALEAAARQEPFGPLAALILVRAAETLTHAEARSRLLDDAVTRAPALAEPRWARFAARLRWGDAAGAVADAEHLEAAATGARARHEICARAARGVLDAGFVRDAGKLFERALRYLPDDASATAGLARSLLDLNRTDRAVVLLERAVELGDARGEPQADALLDLAKVLAGPFNDLPQAIARARQVPSKAPSALEARALEARWRQSLGDITGASLAYSRLREAAELGGRTELPLEQWLVEAALFERDVRSDLAAAERHLANAVRVRPQDRRIGELYREVAAALAARGRS